MINKFFKRAEIAIVILLLIVLGYSLITRTAIGEIIDVDFWILSYLISLTTPSIFCKSENEKTEQE